MQGVHKLPAIWRFKVCLLVSTLSDAGYCTHFSIHLELGSQKVVLFRSPDTAASETLCWLLQVSLYLVNTSDLLSIVSCSRFVLNKAELYHTLLLPFHKGLIERLDVCNK